MSKEAKAVEEQSGAAAPTGFPLDCVYGVKAGMTRVFRESGESIPVTVLDLSDDTIVTQVKTQEKDGYSALQLGFRAKKQQKAKKAEIGHFKKAKAPAFYAVAERRLDKDAQVETGASVNAEFLSEGAVVDVRSKTKGKGFQGVMKRWNFSGAPATHGHSLSHRVPGSIGMCTSPARVSPGKKLPGQMGAKFQTTQNLKVVEFDQENKLLLVRGAVPGGKNAVVRITKSKKKG